MKKNLNLINCPSPNFDVRARDELINMLVIHYTGMHSCEAALNRLCDKTSGVSCHYLIDEDGTRYNLVREAKRAWHAGDSYWRGKRDINSCSIGIELVNPGHEFGYRSFPTIQIEATIALAQDIIARNPIPARNVVGHSDIAPWRKKDPGELFDWKKLAAAGVGLWPQPLEEVVLQPESMLAQYGYNTLMPGVITAFQRHFRQDNLSGRADTLTTALLSGLLCLID